MPCMLDYSEHRTANHLIYYASLSSVFFSLHFLSVHRNGCVCGLVCISLIIIHTMERKASPKTRTESTSHRMYCKNVETFCIVCLLFRYTRGSFRCVFWLPDHRNIDREWRLSLIDYMHAYLWLVLDLFAVYPTRFRCIADIIGEFLLCILISDHCSATAEHHGNVNFAIATGGYCAMITVNRWFECAVSRSSISRRGKTKRKA